MSYWDTSALGKLYVQEADSADFDRKAAAVPLIITSDLARFEMHRIAFRKEAEGQIPTDTAEEIIRQLESDITVGEIRIIPISSAIETAFVAVMAACFRHQPSLPLRTFDAVHLASARVAGETEIVSTDMPLRAAAHQLGFTLFPI